MFLSKFPQIFVIILLLELNFQSFQDNLFKKIIENNKGKNIMISPFSIYQVLSLLSNGAKGDTQKEILKALYPDKTINENLLNQINSNINQIISNIESENEQSSGNNYYPYDSEEHKVTFQDVNGIFTKNGIELTKEFTDKCKNYNTSYFELISAEQVNKFCSENTNGKIDKIINKIDPGTVLLLINAIYFKGTWVEKFSASETKKMDFVNYDKTKVKVDTMYQKYHSKLYYEDNNVQIISLPYISNKLDFKMIIILPNSKKYSSPLDYLTKENISLNEIYSKLKSEPNIHLYLPKFKYEFESDFTKILKYLGINLAFLENADFGNLCQKETYVDRIFQKTYINLNENGTEAAAVTAVNMYPTSIEEEEYYMNVDHSFIYIIQSNKIEDIDNKYLMPFIGIVNELKESGEKGDNNDKPSDEKGEDEDDPIKLSKGNYINVLIIYLGLIISLFIHF